MSFCFLIASGAGAQTYVADTDPGPNPNYAGCIIESSSNSCSSATVILRDHCVHDSGIWKLYEYSLGANCYDRSMVNLNPTLINCNNWCINEGFNRGSCVMTNTYQCGSGTANMVGQCECKY